MSICKRCALASAVVLALASAPVAFAQGVDDSVNDPGSASVDATTLDAVAVTGSRIVRSGYDTPTPVTMIGEEEIKAHAPINIANVVNQLPAFLGSTTETTNPSGLSGGYTAINSLNLRNLGTTRTLVLLDGKRLPYANLTTGVDINTIPNALIKRVDVVTAGASSVYGSDAVSGVVNFILDKEYIGTKGTAQYGETTYGDNETFGLSLTHGTSFGAEDRGHFLISAEHYYSDGIRDNPRPWYTGRTNVLNPDYTPTNGEPEYLVADYAAPRASAPGAIVTSGPLEGLYFGEGGEPAWINLGPITSGATTIGSPDWRYFNYGQGKNKQDIAPQVKRRSVFSRMSYDVTDSAQVYGEFSYGRTEGFTHITPQYYYGNLAIQADNAFLPVEIADTMADLGLTELAIGTHNADLGGAPTWTDRALSRYIVGVSGDLGLFGTDWYWDVSVNRNISKIHQAGDVNIQSNYRSAVDAVRDANGVVVCRSTLTNPSDGCVPFNILGTGTSSEQARAYVTGHAWMDQKWTQDTLFALMSGEPFSTWSGPVSLAFGLEHRREKLSGEANPLGYTNGFWAANFKATQGENDVSEAFVETVIPLAKDASWAKALDFNAAFRGTEYSNSGYVQTWKAGLSYTPIDDIRIRATRSRDIRAPNLVELFQPGLTRTLGTTDPFTNQTVNYLEIAGGNPDLKPEIADTINLGVIVQPRFLPGFSASVDYFEIDISDSISNISNPLQRCYDGETIYCSLVDRDAQGTLVSVRQAALNIARRLARGIDYEVSYVRPVGEGALSLRAMASNYREMMSDNGQGTVTDSIGGSVPEWRYRIQANYQTGPVSLSLTARGLSELSYNNTYIECASNCPTSIPDARTININTIPSVRYFDLGASYRFTDSLEWFLSVSNLLDKDPPQVGGSMTSDAPNGTRAALHDIYGRSFQTGLRFQF